MGDYTLEKNFNNLFEYEDIFFDFSTFPNVNDGQNINQQIKFAQRPNNLQKRKQNIQMSSFAYKEGCISVEPDVRVPNQDGLAQNNDDGSDGPFDEYTESIQQNQSNLFENQINLDEVIFHGNPTNLNLNNGQNLNGPIQVAPGQNNENAETPQNSNQNSHLNQGGSSEETKHTRNKKKKKGRKGKNSKEIGIHTRTWTDNIIRKIKVHYLNYVLELVNRKIKKKYQLLRLIHEISKILTRSFNRRLFRKNFKKIFYKTNISFNYKKQTIKKNRKVIKYIYKYRDSENKAYSILEKNYADEELFSQFADNYDNFSRESVISSPPPILIKGKYI